MQGENRKRALITGITGQDGSYLAELLISKGYEVHGIIRRASSFNTQRIDHIFEDHHVNGRSLHTYHGDLLDSDSLRHVLQASRPDEVYNLAAQSHVKISFDQPVYTAEVIAIGTLKLLEAIRDYRDASGKEIRFYQASSSELFGNSPPPQSEETPFEPRSPYACAKLHAYWSVANYREAYGLFACNGILFNHESPRRGETFVTRKITRAATRIRLGLQDKLYLGNLDARRDWGYAPEYVEAMWLMLQKGRPGDYVVATGESTSVRDFAESAFECLGLDWRDHVEVDESYCRPNEVDCLRGDATKAAVELGWEPKTSWWLLCKEMIEADMRLAEAEKKCGHRLTAVGSMV